MSGKYEFILRFDNGTFILDCISPKSNIKYTITKYYELVADITVDVIKNKSKFRQPTEEKKTVARNLEIIVN